MTRRAGRTQLWAAQAQRCELTEGGQVLCRGANPRDGG